MLLTITTTHQPATDLGYLRHKNPTRLHTFPLSFGQAHGFYPQAHANVCTAALLLDVDPVGLVRNRRGPAGEGGTLDWPCVSLRSAWKRSNVSWHTSRCAAFMSASSACWRWRVSPSIPVYNRA